MVDKYILYHIWAKFTEKAFWDIAAMFASKAKINNLFNFF